MLNRKLKILLWLKAGIKMENRFKVYKKSIKKMLAKYKLKTYLIYKLLQETMKASWNNEMMNCPKLNPLKMPKM